MQKKYIVILTCSLIFVILCLVCGWCLVRQQNMNFAESVISRLGGETALKKKCMQEHTGPVHMEDGTTYERLFGITDIVRIDKLCDCAVEKSYKMVIVSKEHFKPILEEEFQPDAISVLQDVLIMDYSTCENEMLFWLTDKYKTIVIENSEQIH